MGRLDLPDVRRDEDEPRGCCQSDGGGGFYADCANCPNGPEDEGDEADLASTCTVCMRWNRGAAVTFGTTVCGRAYCLFVAKARAAFAGVLVTDEEALD